MYEGLCEVLGPGATDSNSSAFNLKMRPKAEPATVLGNVCVCVGEGVGEWRELKARNSLAIIRAFESRTLESWGYFSDGYNGSGL